MTLIFRLIILQDIWIFHSKVFSSDASNLCKCTAVGNQNKEFRGKTSIMRGGIRYIDIVDMNKMSNNDHKTK